MKLMTIVPVAKPKDFSAVSFTLKDWEIATKIGPQVVPAATAFEATRQSKGLYEIEGPKKQDLEVKVDGLSLTQMDNARLKLFALNLGVSIRKKNMKRSELLGLVQRKLDEVEITDDEEIAAEEDEPEEDEQQDT